MKFKICGDLDTPDWVLAEMGLLNRISSVRFLIIVKQVISEMLGSSIDYSKLEKLLEGVVTDPSGLKGVVAATTFLVRNAVKYQVGEDTLATELQQLGLPLEHCRIIRRPYRHGYSDLRSLLVRSTLRLPCIGPVDWKVSYNVSSSLSGPMRESSVELLLRPPHGSSSSPTLATCTALTLSKDKLNTLLTELQAAHAVLLNVEREVGATISS